MLKLNEIKPIKGSNRKSRRVGRGPGSGKGCTAGYGNNGDRARSGAKTKPYFEGGQTPLTRRLPKRGFHNAFRISYQVINLTEVSAVAASGVVDAALLYSHGLIKSPTTLLKILGDGEIDKALTVKANAFSKSAKTKIEQAKGKAEVV